MGLIQQTIPGLYNGVSQQPSSTRLANQCEEQENAVADMVRGLYKRPPAKYVDKLDDIIDDNTLIHEIVRDTNEKYLVFFTDDDSEPIIVYDLINETKKDVSYGRLDEDLNLTEDGTVKEYLSEYNSQTLAKKRIKAETIADYTIIANTRVTPQMSSDKTETQENVKYVSVSRWYDNEVRVEIEGFANSESTKDDDDVIDSPDEVIEKVKDLIQSLSDDAYVSTNGTYLKVWFDDDREFELSVSGADTDVFSRTVPSYDKLWPASTWPTDKERVRILHDEYGDSVNYYAKSDGDNWIESLGFEQKYKFDENTMPHRLVRMSDGSFVFAPVNWEEKKIGDEESAPTPSFVDGAIQNIFFFQNRLGFLTTEGLVMSRADAFFNLWPKTAMEVMDDDPIDIGIAATQVTVFREVLPFNKNMVIRADTGQFVVSYSQGIMSPKTISVDHSTRFNTIPHGVSDSSGSTLYLLCPNQNHLMVREYYVMPDSMVEDAVNITKHIPTYIPYSETPEIRAVTAMDYMFLRTDEAPYTVFPFQYFWQGEEKQQSAWSKWIFNNKVLGMATVESDLYLVFDVDGTNVLSRINLNTEPKDAAHVDKQVKQDAEEFNSATDKTRFVLPFVDPDTNWTVIDPDTMLALATIEKNEDSDSIYVEGDHTDKQYILGQKYDMVYEASLWFLRDQEGNPLIGTLKLRSVTVSVADTGFFEFVVKYKNRDNEIRIPISGFKVGESDLDEANFLDESISRSIMGDTSRLRLSLENDSHLSSMFQTITYEGFFHTRAEMG